MRPPGDVMNRANAFASPLFATGRSAPGPTAGVGQKPGGDVARVLLSLTAPVAVRVRVVTDDPLVRVALPALLREAGATVVQDDARVDEADVELWAGVDLDGTIADVPAVVLASGADDARRARQAGARGVLARDADPEALLAALVAVAAGLRVTDDSLTDEDSTEPPGNVALPGEGPDALTPREAEALALVAEGLPNKGVAGRLGVSERTARYHVAQILAKLGAQSRTEAVVTAARLGLISL